MAVSSTAVHHHFGAVALLFLVGCDGSTTHADPPKAAQVASRSGTDYVGFWEVVGRSDSGLGSALEIMPEGKCKWGMLAVVDFRYELQDGVLVTKVGEKPFASTPIGKVSGDKWTSGPTGNELERVRVSEVEGNSWIQGVWKYPHRTGATAYERYSPDGLMELRIPMAWQSKTWSLDPSSGKIAIHDTPRV